MVPVLKFLRDKICLELAHFVPSRFDTSNLDGSSICLTQAFNSCFGTGAFSASRYLLSGGISPQFAASQGHDHHLFQALKGKGKERNFLDSTKSSEVFSAIPNPASLKSEEFHSEVTKIVSRNVIPRENEMEMMFLEDRFSIAHENGPTVNLVNCCPEDFRSWATNQASDIPSINIAWIIKSYCLNLKKEPQGNNNLTHLLSVRLEGLLETLYLRLKGTDASGVIVILKAMEESSFCVPVKQDGVRLIPTYKLT